MLISALVFFALLFLLPGLIVHIQSLRYMKKLGATNAIWRSFSPLSFLLTPIVVFPMYSFSIYSILMVPAEQRPTTLRLSLEKVNSGIDNEDVIIKQSVIYAMASVFKIKLDD